MLKTVDCCVHHSWRRESEIYEYLPNGWQEYMHVHIPRAWRDHLVTGAPEPDAPLTGPLSVHRAYRNPLGDHVAGSAGGSSVEGLVAQLDANGITRALLCSPDGVLTADLPTPRLAVEVSRAVNDWTIDRWLTADSRLRATIVVPTQAPDLAAAEIYRLAGHPGISGILLGGGGLAKPFGHPVYLPIFKAAHDVGLPVVLSTEGASTQNAGASPVAGGPPGTYAELRALGYQALESHVSSLITQGVMERFPSLRFLLLGGGAAWVTPWLWRLDTNHRAFRYDSLWTKGRRVSDIFREHFLVGTHPFGFAADPEALRAYFAVDPTLADVLAYASGYPDWDTTSPSDVAAGLPAPWEQRVLGDNASRFFGWDERDRTPPTTATASGGVA